MSDGLFSVLGDLLGLWIVLLYVNLLLDLEEVEIISHLLNFFNDGADSFPVLLVVIGLDVILDWIMNIKEGSFVLVLIKFQRKWYTDHRGKRYVRNLRYFKICL